jgi:hypothetical protein
MTNQHPITPPPELMYQWADMLSSRSDYAVFSLAAQWGADQELKACVEWFANDVVSEVALVVAELRAARRPEPQTLNSVALQMLGTIERDAHYIPEITDTIRRALEALPND